MILKKQFVTLIEMMIVMFLIALITGAIAYNYRGSLEEGKAFKTKMGIEQIERILDLRVADDPELLEGIESNWKEIIRKDPLVKDANSLMRDGWGDDYKVSVQNNRIKVESEHYKEYKKSH